MRTVVDSNWLTTKELRDWLAASSKNIAVLTDQAEMEMAKAASLDGFLMSTAVLADFPRQVILAKEITVASSLRGRKKGMKKRLTDGKRTRAFRKRCRQHDAVRRGETRFSLHEAHENAMRHMEDVLEGGEHFKDDLAEHAAAHYTAEELRNMRTREKWGDALVGKVLDGIMGFAIEFFRRHPTWSRRRPPSARELPFTFVFRHAVCAYLHALHWIHAGGANDRRQWKFGNDFVDVAFVTYGVCFDGILTNDKLAASIHRNARYLIETGFVREDLIRKRAR